ncbi:hypothetical protein L3X38_002879 [Prunus dulcis]|uniref:Uncharacterized protein n=1 Tax=Prunus dulcis TaxID=3755 RepID=A0AAD4ZLE0_PRUDU|nr:hypothetical protein L3X38_002879 [Prunus dulcis]
MPTLGLGLQYPSDLAIVINLTVRLIPNSRDMCPRHIGTFRDSQICDRRSWAPLARLTKYKQFDPSVDRESSEAVIPIEKSGISEAYEECGSDRSGVSEAYEGCCSACEDCGSDRSGVIEDCEDCGLSRLGVSEATRMELTDQERGQPRILGAATRSSNERCEFLGNVQFTKKTLLNFQQKSYLNFIEFWLEGQFGQLCTAIARCRTSTGFDSDFRVEFGSGPVMGC